MHLDRAPIAVGGRGQRADGLSVLMDPHPRAILRFAQKSKEFQLRGIACSGHLIVFSAWDLTHHQVRSAFGLPGILDAGTDFWIVPETDEPLSPDWDASVDDPCRDGFRLIVGRRGDDDAILPLKSWFRSGRMPEPTSTSRHFP